MACLLLAAGLCIVGLSPVLWVFIAGWIVIGVGMGAGLYDAAFATLGDIYGGAARSAITALTLWGGFGRSVRHSVPFSSRHGGPILRWSFWRVLLPSTSHLPACCGAP